MHAREGGASFFLISSVEFLTFCNSAWIPICMMNGWQGASYELVVGLVEQVR